MQKNQNVDEGEGCIAVASSFQTRGRIRRKNLSRTSCLCVKLSLLLLLKDTEKTTLREDCSRRVDLREMSSIKAIRVSLLSQEKRSLGEKSRDNYSSDRMQVCQDWLPHSSRMNIRVIFVLFLKHCLHRETPSYGKYNRFFFPFP